LVCIRAEIVKVTSVVQVYRCHLDARRDLYLIDTPGFNDTYKSDTDILREIASWLGRAYKHRIRLSGIVYLHSIDEVRFAGSAMKNLRMFKELCGEECLGNVVLATTHWKKENLKVQQSREEQLRTNQDKWSFMISKGSKMFRQDRGATSAVEIVRYLVSRQSTVILTIQRELVDEKKDLDKTGAGKEVNADREEERLKFEKRLEKIQSGFQEAKRAKDREEQQRLRAYHQEVEAKLAKIEQDGKKMRADADVLQRQLEEELNEERLEIAKEREKNNHAIVELESDLQLQDTRHMNSLQKQKKEFELEQLKARQASLAWQSRPWYKKLFSVE
jgi:hypothetical protein